MNETISVDAFTLLEYMAGHSIRDGEAFYYPGSALEAARESNLKYRDPRKMSEYTKTLKDAGIVKHLPRGGWKILPDRMETVKVHDLNATVAELVLHEAEEAEDFSGAVDKVSNEQLAVAIARELFNRLTTAQLDARDAYQKAHMTVVEQTQSTHKTEIQDLMKQIEDEAAARRAVEIKAQTYKEKAEKLELQVSALMREVASASDGDEVREAARKFFRTNSNGGTSVSVGSEQSSQKL